MASSPVIAPPYNLDLVTVIIVTYNSREIITQCVEHASSVKNIIVVDNASTDGTADVVSALPFPVTLIANQRNVGFGSANNIALSRVETPFVLLLNPDAALLPGCVETLMETLTSFPDAAAASPLMQRQNGSLDLYLRGKGELDFKEYAEAPDGPICTGFLSAAVMLWKTDRLQALGGFDEIFFLYGEDGDLCRRTEAAGYSMILSPAAKALHLGGKSSPPSAWVRRIRDWHIQWGMLTTMARWQNQDQARRQARAMLAKYTYKTVLYVLLVRPKRVIGNFTKAHACWTWLRGGSAWSGPGAK